MITEEMNKAYKQACINEMKKDLANEFDKVIESTTILAKDKEWAFHMVMSILSQVQK